jgi:hypothetical protein
VPIVHARSLYRWVAAAGVLQVTLTVALLSHILLGCAQTSGLLQGDYGRHAHGSVAATALASLTAAMCAIFLYVVHLAGLRGRSLPSLARALRAQLGWRTVAIIGVAAALLLAGMETGEQLAAGRLDGPLSAFGNVPALGFGLIVLFSAAGNAVLRALCNWLIGVHAHIVSFVSFLLLRDRGEPAGPLRAPFSCGLRVSVSYAYAASQAHGKRAPPTFR